MEHQCGRIGAGRKRNGNFPPLLTAVITLESTSVVESAFPECFADCNLQGPADLCKPYLERQNHFFVLKLLRRPFEHLHEFCEVFGVLLRLRHSGKDDHTVFRNDSGARRFPEAFELIFSIRIDDQIFHAETDRRSKAKQCCQDFFHDEIHISFC